MLSADIQRVINTLEELNIKSTFDNMNKLLGSLQVLADVRNQLQQQEAPAEEKGE